MESIAKQYDESFFVVGLPTVVGNVPVLPINKVYNKNLESLPIVTRDQTYHQEGIAFGIKTSYLPYIFQSYS